jgi:hypothetical protein
MGILRDGYVPSSDVRQGILGAVAPDLGTKDIFCVGRQRERLVSG